MSSQLLNKFSERSKSTIAKHIDIDRTYDEYNELVNSDIIITYQEQF
jgi:hypothetical protein